MISRFRVYEAVTGIFTYFIELGHPPHDAGHLTGSITPILRRRTGRDVTEQNFGETIAVSFPVDTADDYIVRHLLTRVAISPQDIGTRIKYVKV